MGNQSEAAQKDLEQLVQAAQPVGYENVYALSSAGRGPSNVASQQRRALNLAWALRSKRDNLKNEVAWIFGAGAAGLTCAAALKTLGCKVELFDRSGEAMPFQRGCHHRFLHPRMVEWPSKRSTMASANLPLLSWHAGTADDVREQILAGCRALELNPDRIHQVDRF